MAYCSFINPTSTATWRDMGEALHILCCRLPHHFLGGNILLIWQSQIEEFTFSSGSWQLLPTFTDAYKIPCLKGLQLFFSEQKVDHWADKCRAHTHTSFLVKIIEDYYISIYIPCWFWVTLFLNFTTLEFHLSFLSPLSHPEFRGTVLEVTSLIKLYALTMVLFQNNHCRIVTLKMLFWSILSSSLW